jgi:hypothetical protein
METRLRIEGLRSAARQALEAQDQLLNAWRSLDSSDLDSLCEQDDLELLKQLILRRIYPVNAFAVLARVDKYAAIDVLISLYLGDSVDPDRKFGGYTFELSSILDDLREIHGETALRELIDHPKFNKIRLSDSRVIEAFSDSLDIDASLFSGWLENQR